MVVKARGTARQHIQKELNRKEKEAMSGNPARTNPQGSEQTDGGSIIVKPLATCMVTLLPSRQNQDKILAEVSRAASSYTEWLDMSRGVIQDFAGRWSLELQPYHLIKGLDLKTRMQMHYHVHVQQQTVFLWEGRYKSVMAGVSPPPNSTVQTKTECCCTVECSAIRDFRLSCIQRD